MNEPEEDLDYQSLVITQKKTSVRQPRMYLVIILNDDYTPMDFVVYVLTEVFHKTIEEANKLMWDVHTRGRGICGIFPYSVAASKAHHVKELSKKNKHPLECILEPVDNGGMS